MSTDSGKRRNSPVRMAAAALVGLALLLLSGSLTATNAIEARFFDEQARAAFQRRDFDRALEFFLLSATDEPSAGVLYNIAVTAELAQKPRLAFVYFQRYELAEDDDTQRLQLAASKMAALRKKLALVHITSDPPGASIIIDRKELGYFGQTPRTVPLDPGNHTIELELAGHKRFASVARAVVGEMKEISGTLAPRLGRLQLTAIPADAKITLESRGTLVQSVTSGETLNVPLGTYTIRVVRPGYVPQEDQIRVQDDATTRLTLQLNSIAAKRSTILVDTHEVPAKVYLNGRYAGVGPATLRKVPPGTHQIEVKAKGYLPWRQRVVLAPDSTNYVSAQLKPKKSASRNVTR